MTVEEPIFHLVLVTAHRLGIEVDYALGLEGISTMGLVVLCMITRSSERMPLKQVAAQLGCSRQSAGELVGRLVRDGLIERVVHPDDRRLRLLVPTERGSRVGEWGRDALAFCMNSFMRPFSDEEKALFLQLLERLERTADWHRTERHWFLHRYPGPGGRTRRPPSRPTRIHVR